MSKEKVSGVVRHVFYDEKVVNKTKNPEIYYDCYGQPVYIPPGQTGTVKKVRRELVTDSSEKTNAPAKEAADGKKQEQPKGTNPKGSRKAET